jgi:drug/metabolite transporter (DMT)-like permease
MKPIRLSWDFVFGVLLIGGAPMSIFALMVVLGDSFQKLSHIRIPNTVGFVMFAIMFISALLAFIFALRFRLRKRLLPRVFIVVEALLGIVGALFLFAFYGVMVHSIID